EEPSAERIMKLTLRYKRQAVAEMEAATRWYAQQRPELAPDFIGQVNELLKTIATEPERFAIIHRDARQAIMHRFPYSIIFAVRGEFAEVLSVFHSSRNPRIWKRRAN